MIVCVKGKRVSKYLIETYKMYYPMLDTKYLDTLPFYKDSYIMMERLPNKHYKLLRYLFIR